MEQLSSAFLAASYNQDSFIYLQPGLFSFLRSGFPIPNRRFLNLLSKWKTRKILFCSVPTEPLFCGDSNWFKRRLVGWVEMTPRLMATLGVGTQKGLTKLNLMEKVTFEP